MDTWARGYKYYYDEYNAVTSPANIRPELLALAACYRAVKDYEDHCAANGKPDSHDEAKELLVGFADTFIEDGFLRNCLAPVIKIRAEEEARRIINQKFTEDFYADN